MDYANYLLSLPLAQYRAIKRAIRVLQVCGIDTETAIRIVCDARMRTSR